MRVLFLCLGVEQKALIRGTGAFYSWDNDEDICMTDHQHYRHIQVSGNSHDPQDRTVFYELNLEVRAS